MFDQVLTYSDRIMPCCSGKAHGKVFAVLFWKKHMAKFLCRRVLDRVVFAVRFGTAKPLPCSKVFR